MSRALKSLAAVLGLLLCACGAYLSSGCSDDDSSGKKHAEAGTGGSTGTGATGPVGDGDGDGDGGGGGDGDGDGDGPDAPTECNDGVDNDGDGLTDWQLDTGCYGPADGTEAAGSRAEEDGFSTWDFGADSVVVYVSAEGDDGRDGSSPDDAVRTLAHAASLVRDGEHDLIRLRRGDTWRDETLGRFKSGKDAAHPLVIGSYGDSTTLPRIEVDDFFIDHDGQSRDFVALVDLHLFVYSLEPTDPAFDGSTAGVLRYVGGGQNLLVEGCHLQYGELVVQSLGAAKYEHVEVRRSVIEKAYHADTCSPGDPNGSSAHRPSGIYAHQVTDLLLEGNLFDHNGWNEEVPSACATIYNHNTYLNGDGITIRDNVFTRASSIHIKMLSDNPGDMNGTLVENNFFVEGEVGISAGGNTNEAFRFVDTTIRNNVMSDIGRSRPTTRTLAWGIDLTDHDGLRVEDNHLLNQHQSGVTNSYALNVAGGTQRSVAITGNTLYRVQSQLLRVSASGGHESVEVSSNTLVDPDQEACLVSHSGSFGAYTYANNRYYSSIASGNWFCAGGGGKSDLSQWKSASGETGVTTLAGVPFSDPERTIERYAGERGLDATLAGFLGAARVRSRLSWDERLGAPAINDYIRAGFSE